MKVPKDAWDRAPYNRWSFHHIREILPTAEVSRGQAAVDALPRRESNLDGLAVTGVSGENATLATLLEQTFTDGFLVIKDGAVAYERYFSGMTASDVHLSQSVAKSVTGAVAGIMISRGQLDVSAPVTTYLPELAATAWKDATLQQVLDMTTGVRFSEDYTDPLSDMGRMDVACGWKPPLASVDPSHWPENVWQLILTLRETTRPHGVAFEYRSIETDVLAFCMERVSGKRLAQLVSEELWQKLGAEQNACFTIDPDGYAIADGGFNACLRDYARFGQLILEGGRGVVPEQWISATRNGNHQLFGHPYSVTLPEGAYHNQFWIEDAKSRNLMARGVFGQMIYISWEHNMVVVKLSTWPDFLNPRLANATRGACHRIGAALG